MALFEKLLAVRASDQPARIMRERCNQFIKAPPEPDWEATSAMKTK
jgi:adenylate cyclase